MSMLRAHPAPSPSLQPAVRVVIIIFCAEAAHTLLFIPLLQAFLPGARHWTPAFPGYALTAFGTAKLISQAPAGRLVDRLGTRLSATSGLALLLLCGLLFAFVRIPLLFLATACLYGVSAALLWPALFAVVADRYGESLRGRLAAAIQFAEAAGVGIGVGVGSLLVDRGGYGVGFGLYLALIGLGLFTILTTPRSRQVPQSPAPEQEQARVIGILATPLTLDLVLLVLVGCLLTLSPNLLMPIVRSYAVKNLHLPLHDLIVPLIPVAVIGALAMLGSGAASDRVGRLPLTLSGLLLGAVGFWFVGSAHSLQLAIPAAALGISGYLITQPAWSAAVFDSSRAEHRGAQFGLIMVAQGLAEALAPALGGKVAESYGPGATFRLAGAVLALAAALAAWQILERRRSAGR
ncbi:MAG: MFS transporter [Dehalococcoidia bacterium]